MWSMISQVIRFLAIFLAVKSANNFVCSQAADNAESSSCDSQIVDPDILVETTTGTLKGKLVRVPGTSKLAAQFLGVPYAEPPVNELRFKDPQSKIKWDGIYEAFNFGNFCLQAEPFFPAELKNFGFTQMVMPETNPSEDCLFLNIYAPYPFPTKATVMFYMHGGYFFLGSAGTQFYNGKVLARLNDVIVVTINYRLGVFGFLSSGDGRIKGNFGLKDQLLALQWVYQNIQSFGGDFNSITLFGSSAGGASAGYHLLSPLSQDYFNRAILQSGSPNGVWAFMPDLLIKKRFPEFLTSINCPDDTNLLNCLSQASAHDITLKQFIKGETTFDMPWFPSVDGEFLTETPSNLLKQGAFKKTDILTCVDKNEGTLFLAHHLLAFSVYNDSLQTKEQYFKYIEQLQPPYQPHINEIIKYLYVDWNNPHNPERNRDALDEIYGDLYFNCPVIEFTDFYAKANQRAYFFIFSYKSSIDVWPEWAGIPHMAEIEFILGKPLNKSYGFTDEEGELSKKIMTYYSNFAKYGDPNGVTEDASLVLWPQYTVTKRNYLNFLSPKKQPAESAYRSYYCAFWNYLLPKLLNIEANKTL